MGTFRNNYTRGQLNNEGGEELNEMKLSQDKTEIEGNNMTKYKQICKVLLDNNKKKTSIKRKTN